MDKFSALGMFVATAEQGSFSRAAELLGKTPSALTKAVGHLERELGAQLFERRARRIVLTEAGRLYLAQPPLYRLTQGATTVYAMDDADKDRLMASVFKGRGKIEISRFKGLGEMPPGQLKETTMNPAKRRLLRVVVVGDREEDPVGAQQATARRVEELMGRKPELRFAFIQENASLVRDLDV